MVLRDYQAKFISSVVVIFLTYPLYTVYKFHHTHTKINQIISTVRFSFDPPLYFLGHSIQFGEVKCYKFELGFFIFCYYYAEITCYERILLNSAEKYHSYYLCTRKNNGSFVLEENFANLI